MWGSLVWLLWTNPPEPDLARIELRAVSPYGDTIATFYDGRAMWEGEPGIIVPGAPESVLYTLPCTSSPLDWGFHLFSWDTAGNRSDTSNVVTWRGIGP